MKKTLVLVTLFVMPIVLYLFFASGVTNFGRLAVLTEEIPELDFGQQEVLLADKITILGFLGNDVSQQQGKAFNLSQKIYKRFYPFNDFQMVMVMPKGTEADVVELKKELGRFTDLEKWNFIFADEPALTRYFADLKTDLALDQYLGTPYVFIIDKDLNLRGRDNDKEEGIKYGFDTLSVADLNNKMEDDVKIILAEYRRALKKNNTSIKQ